MKVLLLNPPNFMASYTNRDLMGGLGVNNVANPEDGIVRRFVARVKAGAIRIPVLSLVYSASILAENHEVLVIDAANESLDVEKTVSKAVQFKPDWIISTSSISTVELELKLLGLIKQETNARIAVIGDAASLCPDKWVVENGIDYVLVGDEPELAIQSFSKNKTLEGVTGVSKVVAGHLKKSGDPGAITNLDALPRLRWDLFPIREYRYFPMLRHAPFVTALASRGCPYGCIYCPYTSNQGLKYRFRSAQNVFEEIKHNYEAYGVRSVQFRDPTFTLRKDRIEEFCDLIIKSGMKLELGCETRIDCLNEKLIDKMVEAGFRGVNIGIESTDPSVIRNAKRGWISPELIEKNVRHLRNNGVRVAGFFVLGLPGENRQTVETTLDFSRTLPLSYAEFKIATPFPGTPLLEMALQNKWIEEVNHKDYSSYKATMKIHPDLNERFLEEALSDAYKKFYFRPSRILSEVFSERFVLQMIDLMVKATRAGNLVKEPLFNPSLVSETKKAA